MVSRSEVFRSEDARRLQIQGPKRCTIWTEDMAVWNQRYPEGYPWHYTGIREFRRDSHAPFACFAVAVQQPCSNPSKSPEKLGKAPMSEYDDLQEFCKLQKSAANYRAALAWRRSGVRVPSGPLSKPLVYAEYSQQQRGLAAATSPLDSYLIVTRSRQYILHVNIVWSPCSSANNLPPRRLCLQTLESPPSLVKSTPLPSPPHAR